MRWATFGVFVLFVVAVVVFNYLRVKKGGLCGLFAKTVTSALFIVTAVFATISKNGADHTFSLLIICGMTFGFCGDIMLDLKNIYKEHKAQYIYAGMISFGIGHIFYSSAFLASIKLNALSIILPIIVATGLACGIIFSAKLFKLDYKGFKIISFSYSFLMSLALGYAFLGSAATAFSSKFVVVSVAMVLFVVSDIILSHCYFSIQNSDEEGGFSYNTLPLTVIANHSTYYAAQILLALSILL